MIDIKTVFICIIHVTLFYSVIYLLFWLSQKSCRGFGCWTLATISNFCLYAAVMLRVVSFRWLSVAAVALFLGFSAILHAAAVRRFTINRGFHWSVYLLPLVLMSVNLYCFFSERSLVIRYVILLLLIIPFNYLTCKRLFLYKPLVGRIIFILGGVFFFMRFVGMAFETVVVLVHGNHISIFDSPDMGSYLLFMLIAEIGIGILFFMFSSLYSQELLLKMNYSDSGCSVTEVDDSVTD